MNYFIRIFVVCCLLISTVFAEQLEIKFNGKKIELPYWVAEKNSYGAVILIHGGQQAKWSLLLESLAKDLAKNGWSTVLVNCNQGNPEPWIKELPEVISTLRQQNNQRVIVVHYGEQLKQTLDSFNKATHSGIEGLILLSAYNLTKTEDQKPELTVPVFDIAAQFDYELILEQMDSRKKLFGQKKYLAMKIPGAYHDYEYSQKILLSFMSGWMLRLTEFKPAAPLISYIESIAPLMPKQVAFDTDSDWMGFVDNVSDEESQEIIVS